MINYGTMRSSQRPQEIEITNANVFIASDIATETKDFDGRIIEEYIYNYTCYSKDEYILLLAQKSQSLEQELAATKIILGVE